MSNLSLYALTVLIWGSTWYAITFQIGVVHPLLSIAYRFGLASIVLFIFLALRGRLNQARFSLKQHAFIALQGLFLFCLNYWLNYKGTGYLPSGLVSVVFSTIMIMNIFNQRLFFKMKIKRNVIIGSLLGLIGICLIFWQDFEKLHFGDKTTQGFLIILSASYIASIGNIIAAYNYRHKIPVMESNCLGMFYGALFSFILALLNDAPLSFNFTTPYILSLLYLSIFGSAIAFGTYLTLVKNIGADKASYAGVMFPVVALTISTFLEGYIWTTLSICGVAITLLGNVVAMRKAKH